MTATIPAAVANAVIPMRSTSTVLARVVALTLKIGVAEGMRRDALVEAAGLQEVDLGDPDARVPLSTQVALLQLIAKGARDPGAGVRAGAALDVREIGVLGYLLSYSASLGDAVHRLVRYSRVLTEAFEMTWDVSDEHACVTISHHAVGAAVPFAIDYRMAAIVTACRQITGVQVVPVEVTFAYRQPASVLEHRQFFRCPLTFRQPASKIVFALRDLDLPVAKGNEALARYLSEYADQVLGSLLSGTSFGERVRLAIWSAMGSGRPTLSRVADGVGLPARTLQRRLADEGTSLQDEIEEVRKAMAMATLRDRRMSIEEVAFLLGYAEPSTFFRSFRRWTGTTPHEYRRTTLSRSVAPDAIRVARNATTDSAGTRDL